MEPGDLRRTLRTQVPELVRQIDPIVDGWLGSLLHRLASVRQCKFRPKQIHDPAWGTIDLMSWEVALLDTPLLQRLRGVRQLGLAHLVFPGVTHDRLGHSVGVVAAAEIMVQALNRHIARWNLKQANHSQLPPIEDHDRYAIRLAALLHDIGHGPFSHALEPVLGSKLLPQDQKCPWRDDISTVRNNLKLVYELNSTPSMSEVLAVMMVLSEAFTKVLNSHSLFSGISLDAAELQEKLVAAIIGGSRGPGASHLSAVISSQIDADKLDYLARDAHHAGLEIGFDTDRLLAKLELLYVTADRLDPSASELVELARNSPHGVFYQIGIAASGFGSFEQMLIGRTFLYDRLYHHHKVRAAEAMAQRMVLALERDRGRPLDLNEMFLAVGDDTVLQICSGNVAHPLVATPSPTTETLARGITGRTLLHRAFAFRGRFIAVPPDCTAKQADGMRRELWPRIVKAVDNLPTRYDLEMEIHHVALTCAETLRDADVEAEAMAEIAERLGTLGPDAVIVDLPPLKAEAIRILARFPNGMLKVPEFSFNPVKWSDAYELQKRTGYVYCPSDVVPVVSLAAKLVFLTRFGVVMGPEADGYIKSDRDKISEAWRAALITAGIMDEQTAARLTTKRLSLVAVRSGNLNVPEAWSSKAPDLSLSLAQQLNDKLRGGLAAEHLTVLGRVMAALFAFVDTWFAGEQGVKPLEGEGPLQQKLRDCLRYQNLKVDEGSRVGGGALDLYVEDAILIENKFHGKTDDPHAVKPAAGMQGRRYAIALNAQVVIVVIAYQPLAGKFPDKHDCVSVHRIAGDSRTAEIRFTLPYGAVLPSHESA